MVYFAVTAQSFKIARSKIINVWKRWNKPPISHIPILIQPKPFNKLFEPPTKYSFFFLFHILLLRAFLWLTIDQHNSSVAITLRKFLILFNKTITVHYTLSTLFTYSIKIILYKIDKGYSNLSPISSFFNLFTIKYLNNHNLQHVSLESTDWGYERKFRNELQRGALFSKATGHVPDQIGTFHLRS